MEKIRKNAVLVGLIFYTISIVMSIFDFGNNNEIVKQAIEPFIYRELGQNTDDFILSVSLLYFLCNPVFYYLAWKNSKHAIWLFFVIYVLNLLLVLAEWGIHVQMGIIEYLGSISYVADGVILCCLILALNQVKQNKLN
jgi:hypothetical protein